MSLFNIGGNTGYALGPIIVTPLVLWLGLGRGGVVASIPVLIGAFALSNNLFVIALGLGIGAMFVRTLTILLVEHETLAEYRYLEHGAFWAIIVLALIMLTSVLYEVPEVVTGLIGALLIAASLLSSIKHNRTQ